MNIYEAKFLITVCTSDEDKLEVIDRIYKEFNQTKDYLKSQVKYWKKNRGVQVASVYDR